MDGRGMGALGGGGGGASGAQRAQRTLDFGACAQAGGLDGRGSIRWRRGTKAALAKEAQAAAEKLGDLQIERAALQKQQAEFEAWTAAERRRSAKRIVGSMPAGQSSMSNAAGARHEGRGSALRPRAARTVTERP
jgi:hypothetical protein